MWTTTGTTTGGTIDRSADVSGVITDETGSPLEGVSIRFCDLQTCQFSNTDASGAFALTGCYAGWNSYEAVSPMGSGLATTFAPILLATDQSRDLSLTMPTLEAAPALGPTTEIEVATGLAVTVGTGDLTPPLLVDEATEVAGVLLDPAHWVPADEIAGTTVAQWYLWPFDHHAESGGLPIRVHGAALGLSGASYTMYVGSYGDFAWNEVGTFEDGDADGWYESTGTLPLMSTVLLVE